MCSLSLLCVITTSEFVLLCMFQLQDLICEILQGQLVMFDKNSFHSVLSTTPFSAYSIVVTYNITAVL